MSDNQNINFDLDKLLADSKFSDDNKDIYINHATFAYSPNEILIDFFYLRPTPGNLQDLQAKHIQRVVIPLNLKRVYHSSGKHNCFI